MADHTKLPYLRLVTTPPAGRQSQRVKEHLDLSVERAPNVLGLFWFAPTNMRQFVKAISSSRPRYIFDLRALPAFDGVGMSRRSVFRLMESSGCTYVDAIGRIGGKDRLQLIFESEAFETCVRSVCGNELVGPMFFLFQSGEDLVRSSSVLPKILQPAPREGWSVHVLGGEVVMSIDAFAKTVQPWTAGDVLYVVTSPSESTGWLLDDSGRPTDPIDLPRGSSVRVTQVQIGQWTDVEVLAGPHQGRSVRLAPSAHVAHLVK